MKNVILTALIASSFLIISCNKNDKDPVTPPSATLNNEINDFVWKALNAEYYWQKDVPNLADTKDDEQDDYYSYLNGFSDPEDLFASLIFDAGNTDRFSWYIDDYTEQSASFRGVSDSFGFEFGVARLCSDCDEVLGYVTYVVPNSPASDADMKRGDIFNVFNGVTLNLSNYSIVNKYFSDQSISLGFATLENGNLVSNGKNETLNVIEITENPVFYSDVITNSNSTKIGYLVYNAFRYTFHEELNDVFGDFKTQGIQELVLDLRYNGGGQVLTSAYLASMIYGGAATNEVFAKLIYNSKNSGQSGAYPFYDQAAIYNKDGSNAGSDVTINRLSSLNRMYVIVSDDTASASEMIINGLRAYLGDSNVILIGTTTYGKNVGSYTVYDSPDFTNNNVNPNHTVAMQPITFKIFNKLDQSDYTLGFEPDYEQIEYVSEMKPFGDLNEPLLKTALDLIENGSITKSLHKPAFETELLMSSLDKKPFSKEMYIFRD